MAMDRAVTSFRDIAITRTGSQETTMHPFGMYLAITDRQGEHGWPAAGTRRPSFALVDALPITEPEPEPASRIGRLAAIVRRRVVRTAGA